MSTSISSSNAVMSLHIYLVVLVINTPVNVGGGGVLHRPLENLTGLSKKGGGG